MLSPVNAKMINAVSSGVSFNSDPFELTYMVLYDITASVSGTCTGSIKLQKTNDDYETVAKGSAVWFDIGSSSQAFTNATTLNWTASDVGYNYLRAAVTVATGTAVITVRINAKGE